MNSGPDLDREQVLQALASATRKLLDSRVREGYWEGELSSSALSTATAVLALALLLREGEGRLDRGLLATCRTLVAKGTGWLVRTRNPDGGFGDTVGSPSNLSTTVLVWAALTAADGSCAQTLAATRAWLTARAGGLDAEALAAAITARYGEDRTFSAPILTACALAGAFASDTGAWNRVPQLPFELAVCPRHWFKWLRLPVVSYALPALIAIGQVRHHFNPTRNPLLRLIRSLARRRSLEVLQAIQPESGGYLEAIPLTSFVIMSLAASGQVEHPVVLRGVDFLAATARRDGAWPIDTNLATWVTTQSLGALAAAGDLKAHLGADERRKLRGWLLAQQFRSLHPFTHADPGGWAWTDLPGGVPDADDTAGALLALSHLGPGDAESSQAASAGVEWLLDLQNADGGIPTFCRGWGRLPFDRSSPDLAAHALLAWSSWQQAVPPRLRSRLQRARRRAVNYLARLPAGGRRLGTALVREPVGPRRRKPDLWHGPGGSGSQPPEPRGPQLRRRDQASGHRLVAGCAKPRWRLGRRRGCGFHHRGNGAGGAGSGRCPPGGSAFPGPGGNLPGGRHLQGCLLAGLGDPRRAGLRAVAHRTLLFQTVVLRKRVPGHFHRGRPGSRGVHGLSVHPVQHLGRRRRKQVACRVTDDQAYRGGQSRNPHPINPAQRPLQESRDAVEQD